MEAVGYRIYGGKESKVEIRDDAVGREMEKGTSLRAVRASFPKTEASFFSLACKRLTPGTRLI
jgi:hypothetical protein